MRVCCKKYTHILNADCEVCLEMVEVFGQFVPMMIICKQTL